MALIELNVTNFDEMIQMNPLVLVDFYSISCRPCRAIIPMLEELAAENIAVIGKLDIHAAPEIAARFEIWTLPTLLLFRNGVVAEQFTGVQSKEKLRDAIQSE